MHHKHPDFLRLPMWMELGGSELSEDKTELRQPLEELQVLFPSQLKGHDKLCLPPTGVEEGLD